MTAEIVIPGRSNEPIPPGDIIFWLNALGRLASLHSLSEGEGFSVATDDDRGGGLAVTPENRRRFLLPNGQMVIPG